MNVNMSRCKRPETRSLRSSPAPERSAHASHPLRMSPLARRGRVLAGSAREDVDGGGMRTDARAGTAVPCEHGTRQNMIIDGRAHFTSTVDRAPPTCGATSVNGKRHFE